MVLLVPQAVQLHQVLQVHLLHRVLPDLLLAQLVQVQPVPLDQWVLLVFPEYQVNQVHQQLQELQVPQVVQVHLLHQVLQACPLAQLAQVQLVPLVQQALQVSLG